MIEIGELKVEHLEDYVNKGAVITIEYNDDFILTVKKIGLPIRPKLAIEGYGEFPFKVAYSLMQKNALRYWVHEKPPKSSYCPIAHQIIEKWGGVDG